MNNPVVITTRSRIRGVAAAYKAQYGAREDATYTELAALDSETATPADVGAVFQRRYGHNGSGWIDTVCDNCGKDTGLVVRLGEEPDYESATAEVCLLCLKAAIKAVRIVSPQARGGRDG